MNFDPHLKMSFKEVFFLQTAFISEEDGGCFNPLPFLSLTRISKLIRIHGIENLALHYLHR